MALHQDLRDLLAAFAEAEVEYLLIGGYAVAFYAEPRFTKDIDLLIASTPSNVKRVVAALEAFGAPRSVTDAVQTAREDEIVYMGEPPVRVELFRQIPGIEFASAYANRTNTTWDGVPVQVIGRQELIAAKRATDRPQDRQDVATLVGDEPE